MMRKGAHNVRDENILRVDESDATLQGRDRGARSGGICVSRNIGLHSLDLIQ